VFIKCAKTDPFQHVCFIFLGCGSAPLCPVSVLTSYRPLHGLGIGPLLRALLSLFLQSTLQAAGIPEKFSGHSFRISTTTLPAQRGVLDYLIKSMGRWWSETYILCVRKPVGTILSIQCSW